ncbi:MAG: hypothetical protein U1A27_03165 [Phycisphaerae bacterium]
MSDRRRITAALLLAGCFAAAAAPLNAQEPPTPADDTPTASDAEQFQKLLQQAKDLGPWENEAALRSEAADLFFERQHWNSEPDLFARNLVHDVDRIPPWQFQQRMDAFLSGVQQRYDLGEAQKIELGQRLGYESFRLTLKYFKDATPIAMEIIKTRAAGKPFTPEQVARWARRIQPMMDDARAAIVNVADGMAKSMTPAQRAILKRDVDAFKKRHGDVVQLMDRWSRGEWDPTQWGLDNDPVHAAAVAAKRAADRLAGRDLDPAAAMPAAAVKPARPEDESAWARYVREFCAVNGFDDVQKKSARAILVQQLERARNFRQSRSQQLAALSARAARLADAADRAALEKDILAELAPIAEMFNELCARLEDLMTAEQRARLAPAKPATPVTPPGTSPASKSAPPPASRPADS